MRKISNTLQAIKSPFIRLRILTVFILSIFLFTACNEEVIRQLGAKGALAGQNLSSSAVLTLSNMAGLESVDYNHRLLAAIIVQPKENLNNMPTIKHNDRLLEDIALRIRAYKTFGKAYAALHRLADTPFGDQTKAASDELIGSINNLQGIPDLPSNISSVIPSIAKLIIDAKQAKDIKKHNQSMYQLCQAFHELWKQDMPTWNMYLDRVESAYLNSLNSVPVDHFDPKLLEKNAQYPYATGYLANIYKADEATKYTAEISKIRDELVEVDQAFTLMEGAHKELAAAKPSYNDVIATVDKVIVLIQEIK